MFQAGRLIAQNRGLIRTKRERIMELMRQDPFRVLEAVSTLPTADRNDSAMKALTRRLLRAV